MKKRTGPKPRPHFSMNPKSRFFQTLNQVAELAHSALPIRWITWKSLKIVSDFTANRSFPFQTSPSEEHLRSWSFSRPTWHGARPHRH